MSASYLVPNSALLFAALSGPFDPKQALQHIAASESAQQLAMTASHLADACDTRPAGTNNRWLMRTPARHSLLKSLAPEQLFAAVETRREHEPDVETADLLGVLLDQAPLGRDDIQAIVRTSTDPSALERVILALDRAGELAPARDLLHQARSALSEFHRTKKLQRVAERGFFGREVELGKIEDWLAHPVHTPPVTCLFITGDPGIGKSSLLAESVRLYYERHHPLILRLDFDRAGLDVQDQLGLTLEAARQLAEQLGEASGALLEARLAAGRADEGDARKRISLRQQFPVPLVEKIGKAVAVAGRPVLVVLDTLEVLRGRGETHPASLFSWMDNLVRQGISPMAVLAAGRGDALEGLHQIAPQTAGTKSSDQRPPRVKHLELRHLEDQAARALLTRQQVEAQDHTELLAIGAGNPLKLRLAAEIFKRSGLEHLPKRRRGSEISAAFLYRLLLSRIDDPELRRLAHPGLIARRINAELIQRVLAPSLGLGTLTATRAQALLDQLASHHWLVEPDPGAPGFLKHRSDMRRLLLPLLYQSAPKQSGRVDAAALRWFGARPEPWAQVEAVYHQLQLTRTGRAVPTVSAQIAAQFDTGALVELPVAAADQVRRSAGQRTSQFRSAAHSGNWGQDDESLAKELYSLLQRQDWQEGAFLVRNVVQDGTLDPRSPAADAIRTFLWRAGRWADARRWLEERDRFDSSDADLHNLPEAVVMARLEMRAEFVPERLRRSWRDWQPLLQEIDKAGAITLGSDARHGALALVLWSLPTPYPLSPASSSDIADSAAAAIQRWGGVQGGAVEPALYIGQKRLANAGISDLPSMLDMPFGSALAPLSPYPGFVTNQAIAAQRQDLREWAKTAVAVITKAGGLLGPRLSFRSPADTDPVLWLTNVGLLAEWLEATAFIRKDADLALIGRSAERWRRTMAGDWSIGQRRGHWRSLPVLDETLAERQRLLLEAPKPARAALLQIDTWGVALSYESLHALLLRRLRGALTEANVSLLRGDPLSLITRRLLTRGAPAAVAPALAVLIAHRAL